MNTALRHPYHICNPWWPDVPFTRRVGGWPGIPPGSTTERPL